MDDKNQKERLEQELRFLKESFDAEVISKEEFEKGSDRIDKKLGEIKGAEKKDAGEAKKEQETKISKKPEEPKADKAEAKEEVKIKLKVIQDNNGEQQYFEESRQQEDKPAKSAAKNEEANSGQKTEGKFFKYAVVFVVLALLIFFSYSFFSTSKEVQEKTGEIKLVAACSSNGDCRQEGKTGSCLKQGTKDAKCEFSEIPKTNVLVLNDKRNCFNCGTQRVLGILESWFGSLNAKEVDYNTDEGKRLADNIDARLLPAYVFGSNLTQKSNFEQFRQVFAKINNSYVLSESAAASTFYFRRDNEQNRLDLFVIAGDSASIRAESNLKEFLENFKEVKFEKHLSTEPLAKELGIKTFPTFLVNNRIKFGGIQTAENIKTDFCRVNKLPECGKSLSSNLI